MYYETNKIIRFSSHVLFWGIILFAFIQFAVLMIFSLFLVFFGSGKSGFLGPSFYELILIVPVSLFLICVPALSCLFLIRVYQIIEKWDQLFTVKNASKFLDLGLDGENYLRSNLSQSEIKLLREKKPLTKGV